MYITQREGYHRLFLKARYIIAHILIYFYYLDFFERICFQPWQLQKELKQLKWQSVSSNKQVVNCRNWPLYRN